LAAVADLDFVFAGRGGAGLTSSGASTAAVLRRQPGEAHPSVATCGSVGQAQAAKVTDSAPTRSVRRQNGMAKTTFGTVAKQRMDQPHQFGVGQKDSIHHHTRTPLAEMVNRARGPTVRASMSFCVGTIRPDVPLKLKSPTRPRIIALAQHPSI